MTVTGITWPFSSKIWDMPTFLPMIAFMCMFLLLRLLVGLDTRLGPGHCSADMTLPVSRKLTGDWVSNIFKKVFTLL